MLAWKGQVLLDKITLKNRKPTQQEHKNLLYFKEESYRFIERAKSLGWKLESPNSREEYLRTINEEKSRRDK